MSCLLLTRCHAFTGITFHHMLSFDAMRFPVETWHSFLGSVFFPCSFRHMGYGGSNSKANMPCKVVQRQVVTRVEGSSLSRAAFTPLPLQKGGVIQGRALQGRALPTVLTCVLLHPVVLSSFLRIPLPPGRRDADSARFSPTRCWSILPPLAPNAPRGAQRPAPTEPFSRGARQSAGGLRGSARRKHAVPTPGARWANRWISRPMLLDLEPFLFACSYCWRPGQLLANIFSPSDATFWSPVDTVRFVTCLGRAVLATANAAHVAATRPVIARGSNSIVRLGDCDQWRRFLFTLDTGCLNTGAT
ncbi:unnamed protein product [Prorocentrum cordatum]|uniref:Uncharacterized protein n=1 Tax=Prorocentrum cordatum TaxID=2364126 RepID=A0ABN9QX41_9DINO|nr:unnamed protein product [Polarella glacialis]